MISEIVLTTVLMGLMALLARMGGGGWIAPKLWSRLPELIFAIPFGASSYFLAALIYDTFGFALPDWLPTGLHNFIWANQGWIPAIVGILGWQMSYWAMEMGHGTVYRMQGWDSKDPNRVQSIERLVRLVYKGDIRKPLYSWLCMGFKGFAIGLAAFPFGLLLSLLWPFAYYLGYKIGNTEASEKISGAFAGLVVGLNYIFIAWALTLVL